MNELHDMDPAVRERAIDGLEKLGNRAPLDPLIDALRNNSSVRVRTAAAQALGRTHNPNAVLPLAEILTVSKAGQEAIEPLMAIGAPVVSKLVEMVNDPRYVNDDQMTIAICSVLGRVRDSATIPLLFDVYERGGEDVRYTADWALDQMDRQAVEAWERRRLVSRGSSVVAVGAGLLGIGYLAWRAKRQRLR